MDKEAIKRVYEPILSDILYEFSQIIVFALNNTPGLFLRNPAFSSKVLHCYKNFVSILETLPECHRQEEVLSRVDESFIERLNNIAVSASQYQEESNMIDSIFFNHSSD